MIFEWQQNACKTLMKKPINWSELKKSKLFQAFHKHCTAYEFNKIIEMSKSYKNQN